MQQLMRGSHIFAQQPCSLEFRPPRRFTSPSRVSSTGSFFRKIIGASGSGAELTVSGSGGAGVFEVDGDEMSTSLAGMSDMTGVVDSGVLTAVGRVECRSEKAGRLDGVSKWVHLSYDSGFAQFVAQRSGCSWSSVRRCVRINKREDLVIDSSRIRIYSRRRLVYAFDESM